MFIYLYLQVYNSQHHLHQHYQHHQRTLNLPLTKHKLVLMRSSLTVIPFIILSTWYILSAFLGIAFLGIALLGIALLGNALLVPLSPNFLISSRIFIVFLRT